MIQKLSIKNLQKWIILVLLISTSTFVYSQNRPNYNWAKSIGGTETVNNTMVATDSMGNKYVSGRFIGTIIFGNDTFTSSNYNFFITKYNKKGNLIWSKKIKGGAVALRAINVDRVGNIYIGGIFDNTIIFNNDTINNIGGGDIFIAKFGSNGNEIWVRTAKGDSDFFADGLNALTTDKFGNIYISGSFYSPKIIFGSNDTLFNKGTQTSDMYFAKYTTNGNLVWVKQIGGIGIDNAKDITIGKNNNLYITGFFSSPNLIYQSDTLFKNIIDNEVFVARFNANGVLIWSKKFGGIGSQLGISIAADNSNQLYIGGNFESSLYIIGNDTLVNSGGSDAFIFHLDSLGNPLFLKKIGGTSSEYLTRLNIDAQNNIYIIGDFESPKIYFQNDSIINKGQRNVFVISIQSNGSLIWLDVIGGLTFEQSSSISLDHLGNCLIGGSFFSQQLNIGSFTLSNNYINFAKASSFVIQTNSLRLNKINGNQTICYGDSISKLTGIEKFNPQSNYIWIQSSVDSTSNFTIALGTNNQRDFKNSIYQSSWFRRVIKTGTISDTSNAVKINVLGKAIAKFKVDNQNQCFNNNIFNLTDSSIVNGSVLIQSYKWELGDGTISTQKNTSKTYNKSGRYKIKLTVTTNNLCVDTSIVFINVYDSPKAKISLSNKTQCLNQNTFNFKDSTTIGSGIITSRFWSFGDGTTSSLINPVKTYSNIGIYNVKLITISNNGCSDSTNVIVTVLNNPVAGSIAGPNTNIQTNTQYLYNINQQLNHTYEWQIENGAIISGQGTNAINIQWLNNGKGILRCIITNTNNCTDTAKLQLNVGPTGINEIKNSNIKIYPNPTNNIINIEGLNKNENNTIHIFDVQGKLVITKTITDKGTIDLSELNKGVYVIKIGEVAQRIVKM
jgi:PKD repeat protein